MPGDKVLLGLKVFSNISLSAGTADLVMFHLACSSVMIFPQRFLLILQDLLAIIISYDCNLHSVQIPANRFHMFI